MNVSALLSQTYPFAAPIPFFCDACVDLWEHAYWGSYPCNLYGYLCDLVHHAAWGALEASENTRKEA